MRLSCLLLLVPLAVLTACGPPPTPETVEGETVTGEAKEGTMTEGEDDPYLWLEEIQGEKSLNYARAQNERTFGVLKADPRFATIETESLEILEAKDRIPYGTVKAGFVYNFWNDDKNVRGLWRRIPVADYLASKDEWETLLDVDVLAEQEAQNWVWHGESCLAPGYEHCMLELSIGGKDAAVFREFDLKTKTFVEGGFELPEAKSQPTWLDQDTLLLGTDFGAGTMTDSGYPRTLRVWKRGTPYMDAAPLFEVLQDDMIAYGWVNTGKAQRTVMLTRMMTFYTNKLFLVSEDLTTTLELPLPDDVEPRGFYGDDHLLLMLRNEWVTRRQTFKQGSVVAVNLKPARKGLAEGVEFELEPTLIFEPTDHLSLNSLDIAGDQIVLGLMADVKARVTIVQSFDGQWQSRDVDLPGNAGVAWLTGSSEYEDNFFLVYEDPTTPESLYYWSATDRTLSPVRSLPARWDAAGVKVEQRWATSKDGTQIPYFLVLPKNFVEGTPLPTFLYAYGGFEISITPGYQPLEGKFWVEKGGVYVIANIRGGGEYGPRWHQAALKENRQLAYDDFAAVAQALLDTKVTTVPQLGIRGGSNGGLLMGVEFTQHPDLFGAVICEVPLLDMMRYNKLLAGASWMAEYGNPDVPEERKYILEYSPYQNVKADVVYPPIFFTSSTADDRVHPGHARKMSKKMLDQGHENILYFENIEGGHGGVTNQKQAAMKAGLKYVFLMQQLGVE